MLIVYYWNLLWNKQITSKWKVFRASPLLTLKWTQTQHSPGCKQSGRPIASLCYPLHAVRVLLARTLHQFSHRQHLLMSYIGIQENEVFIALLSGLKGIKLRGSVSGWPHGQVVVCSGGNLTKKQDVVEALSFTQNVLFAGCVWKYTHWKRICVTRLGSVYSFVYIIISSTNLHYRPSPFR